MGDLRHVIVCSVRQAIDHEEAPLSGLSPSWFSQRVTRYYKHLILAREERRFIPFVVIAPRTNHPPDEVAPFARSQLTRASRPVSMPSLATCKAVSLA